MSRLIPLTISAARGTPRRADLSWDGLVLLVVLLGMSEACSAMLGLEKRQCSVDEDCWKRGLQGVCVQELCQPLTRANNESGAPGSSQPTSGSAGPMSESNPPDSESPTGAGSGAGSGGASGTAPIVVATAARGGAAPAQGGAGAGGMSAVIPAAGATSATAGSIATPCTGAGCPECASDMDCEKGGLMGAKCIASVCYRTTPQCSADQDCVQLGPEYDGGRCVASTCLPNPLWRCEPTAPQTSTATRKLEIPVLDALTLGALSGVPVLVCQKRDLTCAEPVAMMTSGSNGHVAFDLPENFSGYLQVTQFQDYMPALYFLPTTIPESGVLNDFPLLKSGIVINALAASLGAAGGIDATRGHMMLIAEDCMHNYVKGVSFSSDQMDSKTVQFYVQNELPSADLKETQAMGQGGYLNFPVGTAIIKLTKNDTKLVLSTVSVVVRKGFISVAFIPPMSR